MKRAKTTISTVFSLLASAVASQAMIVSLSAVADAEVGERPGEDRGGSPTQTSLNTRFVNDNRNELIVVRFDLSSVDISQVTAATLNLVSFRANTSSRPYNVFGIVDGALGGDNNGLTPGFDDNTWDQNSVVMSTMPGLVYDGNAATQGLSGTDLVNLGSGSFASLAEGDVATLNSPGLLAFLSSHPDDLVSFVIARDSGNLSTGQDRFASMESTVLETPDLFTGDAGDFAPFLSLTVVPEPSVALLAGLGGLSLLRRRRR